MAETVEIPGAPECGGYMKAEEDRSWRTAAQATHVEDQPVLGAEYLGR